MFWRHHSYQKLSYRDQLCALFKMLPNKVKVELEERIDSWIALWTQSAVSWQKTALQKRRKSWKSGRSLELWQSDHTTYPAWLTEEWVKCFVSSSGARLVQFLPHLDLVRGRPLPRLHHAGDQGVESHTTLNTATPSHQIYAFLCTHTTLGDWKHTVCKTKWKSDARIWSPMFIFVQLAQIFFSCGSFCCIFSSSSSSSSSSLNKNNNDQQRVKNRQQ